MSPKSLATAFETCLDIKERSGDNTPARMQSTPSPPPDAQIQLPEPAMNGSRPQSAETQDPVNKKMASPRDSPMVDNVNGVDDQATERRQPMSGSGPRRVLLVEDNAINLQVRCFRFCSIYKRLIWSDSFLKWPSRSPNSNTIRCPTGSKRLRPFDAWHLMPW